MIRNSKIVIVDHPITWSGTPHFCTSALKREIENVIVLGSLTAQERLPFLGLIKDHFAQFGRKYLPDRDLDVLKVRAAQINKKLKDQSDADAIVVLHPPDAAFLDTDIPIAIFHDATWGQLTSTYPEFFRDNFFDELYQSGFTAERLAFEKARWLVFMSEWAAHGAGDEYPSLKHKIRVIHPGANLPEAPANSAVEQALEQRTAGPCRILFVGNAGYRKGRDIAIAAVECLVSSGIDAVLHIAGSKKEEIGPSSVVRSYGELSKYVPAEFSLLSQLYLESFALMLPSRAECAGIVICEAAAFGVPAIVPQTGGMPDLVRNGRTGCVLKSGAEPAEYASAVSLLWRDPVGYREMCRNARILYDDVLNWDQAARKMGQMLDEGRSEAAGA